MIRVPFLAGKNVAVIGLGKSGMATARALIASGAQVIVWDDAQEARETAKRHGLDVVDPLLFGLEKIEEIIWSPGIPHTHPQQHPIAAAAKALGKKLVCDIDLLARAKPNHRFIGITGTNGKSTTTTLIAHILQSAGFAMAVGGNLGTAALDLADLPEGGIYVLETSSYQLELSPSIRFCASVLLNITPDHLARHGGMEGYIAAKRKILEQTTGTAVIGIDDEPCRALYRVFHDISRPLSVVESLDNGVSAADGLMREHGRVVADLRSIKTLPGRHNWQNACAAWSVARFLQIDEPKILQALETYPGLAHRQELVATLGGIAYVNDSKATNADAVEKALSCYDAVYWIAGGQAKEGGIIALAPYFPRVRHAFLIGDAAQQFAETLEGKVDYSLCGTLDVALAQAHAMAQQDQPKDGVVLLSPACASWDQFKSFEHRGDVFRTLVAALSERA